MFVAFMNWVLAIVFWLTTLGAAFSIGATFSIGASLSISDADKADVLRSMLFTLIISCVIAAYNTWRIIIKAKRAKAVKSLNDELDRKMAAEKSSKISSAMNLLNNGEIPICQPNKAILRSGEVAGFTIGAALIENKVASYDGGSVSFGLGHGVRVSTGSAAPKMQLSIAASGELCFTNKRIIFAGDKKSFECDIEKLTSYDWGSFLTIHSNTKSFVLSIVDDDFAEVGKATLKLILSRLNAQ